MGEPVVLIVVAGHRQDALDTVTSDTPNPNPVGSDPNPNTDPDPKRYPNHSSNPNLINTPES